MDNPATADDAPEFDTARYILFLLAKDDGRPWLVTDLERQRENPAHVADSLFLMDRAGLIHRFDDRRLVVATQAGIVASEICGFGF